LTKNSLGLCRSYAHLFVIPPAVYVACLVLRKALKKQAEVQEHVLCFDVMNAECLVEGDRAVVHSNIANFMKAMKLVHREASQRETLIKFNEIVRRLLPKAIVRGSGSFGIGYLHVIAIFLSQSLLGLEVLASDLWHHAPARTLLLTFADFAVLHFAMLPLLLGAIASTTRRTLCVKEHYLIQASILAISLGACCAGVGCVVLNNKLCQLAVHSDLALAVWVALAVTLLATTIYSFRQTISCGLSGCCRSAEGTRDLSTFAQNVAEQPYIDRLTRSSIWGEERESEGGSSTSSDVPSVGGNVGRNVVSV